MVSGSSHAKRYKMISFLGEGQFATVYQAEDTEQSGKIVAVKKIKLGHRSEAKDGMCESLRDCLSIQN